MAASHFDRFSRHPVVAQIQATSETQNRSFFASVIAETMKRSIVLAVNPLFSGTADDHSVQHDVITLE